MVREAYMQEIHELLKLPLLETYVTLVVTHLSSRTLYNTCAWKLTSMYIWVYQEALRSPKTKLREAFISFGCYNTPRESLGEITRMYQGRQVVHLRTQVYPP